MAVSFANDHDPSEPTETYAWEEIAKHNKIDDLWLVIKGKVYDVTDYVHEHPGTEKNLLDWAGKDATQAFKDQGHSYQAKEIRQEFLIGLVATD